MFQWWAYFLLTLTKLTGKIVMQEFFLPGVFPGLMIAPGAATFKRLFAGGTIDRSEPLVLFGVLGRRDCNIRAATVDLHYSLEQ